MRSRSNLSWRIAALAAAALLGAVTAPAQTEKPSLPSRVDELFAERGRSDAPGGVVAVFRDGRIVYERAFGMADLERGVCLTPRSAFEIGSISKQFTAMCILLLEQDGKLSLGDDIRDFLPEMPEYDHRITLRHLLHHTSGIRDIETLIPLAGMPWVNHYRKAELLGLIARQRGLNFAPGTEHLYSNSGYLLLAEIVERVSGRSLREFAQQRIFEPLGMKHTVFWDHPAQIVDNRAIAYAPDGDGDLGIEMWNLPFAGPAGLYTTVGDLALWDANFYDNRLGGGAELIERMETPGELENGESHDYAAGLVVGTYRGQRMLSHGGAWMGYRADLVRFPEQRLTVAALSNGARGLGAMRVAELYLEEVLEPSGDGEAEPFEPSETVELEAAELAAWEGTYWNESDGLLREIEVRDGELTYVRSADSATALGALGPGHFLMIGPSVRVDVEFEAGRGGAGRTMTVSVAGEEPLRFEPVEPATGKDLAVYAGDYRSEELGRELRLRLEDGRIEAFWAGAAERAPAVLLPSGELLLQRFVPVPWYRQDVRLRPERDDAGSVSGLTLSCDMVRGVRFARRRG